MDELKVFSGNAHPKLAQAIVDYLDIPLDDPNDQSTYQDLIEQIEQANAAEQAEYGDKDLEERGGDSSGELNSERLKQRIEELNQRLREGNQPKKETQAERKALKKLSEDCLPRLEKYEQQTETLAGRSSYSKTDPDASCMRMKEALAETGLQRAGGDRRPVHCGL